MANSTKYYKSPSKHSNERAEYFLLGGVWLGPVKPDMETILHPIIDKINSLNAEIQTPQGMKHLKAKLLLGVFDLPAKAMAMNIIQFNGRYGCPYCLDEGTYACAPSQTLSTH